MYFNLCFLYSVSCSDLGNSLIPNGSLLSILTIVSISSKTLNRCYKWSITQLCMAFATIRDHVGIFESKRLKGGITLTLFASTEKDCCLLFSIYSSSYFDIWGLRSGVLDVADNHTNTQRNPDKPKITNGPNIPPCDMRMGESVSPIAHPSWNPAIEMPTALARSVWGNHLNRTTKHYSLSISTFNPFWLNQLHTIAITKEHVMSCHIIKTQIRYKVKTIGNHTETSSYHFKLYNCANQPGLSRIYPSKL